MWDVVYSQEQLRGLIEMGVKRYTVYFINNIGQPGAAGLLFADGADAVTILKAKALPIQIYRIEEVDPHDYLKE